MKSSVGAVRVSLVEDDENLALMVKAALQRPPAMSFVEHYLSAEAALAGLPRQAPDVALIDVRLPGISGIELIERLAPRLPEVSFLTFTSLMDEEVVFQALRAGAVGYLLKSAKLEEIRSAVLVAKEGGSPISPGIARKVVQYFHRPVAPTKGNAQDLSLRERKVLESVATGLRDKEVAAALAVSEHTVRTYVRRAFAKLQVSSRAEAVAALLRG